MKHPPRITKKRSAFTLVELLVVIAIIGILISMLLPAAQLAREAARRVSCLNKMRQLTIGCVTYESSFGRFPSAGVYKSGYDRLTWVVYLLPYIEQDNLHSQFDLLPNGSLSPDKWDLSSNRLDALLCPSAGQELADQGAGGLDASETYTTHYLGIAGPIGQNPESGINYGIRNTNHGGFSTAGIFWLETPDFPGRTSRGITDISDGLSNTLLLGEMSYSGSNDASLPWGPPYRGWARGTGKANGAGKNGASYSSTTKNIKYPINAYDFDDATTKHNNINMGSNHPGGCNFSYADGSSRFVSENIDMAIYLAQASADGEESLGIE